MASAATVDPLPEPRTTIADDTASRPNPQTRTHSGRGRSRKRKSGDIISAEGDGKKRTFDDFFNFCSFVLAYEEQLERQASLNTITSNGHTNSIDFNHTNTYANSTHPNLNKTTNHASLMHIDHPNTSHTDTSDHSDHTASSHNLPPPPSSSSCDSSSEEGDNSLSNSLPPDSTHDKLEYTSEDESWNLVTCFCRRPFAGRPMIECSGCNTWVHLFCAKIRKSAVPDVYTCPRCAASSGKAGSRRAVLNS